MCYHDRDFVFVDSCEQLLETVCLIVEPGQLIMHQIANSVYYTQRTQLFKGLPRL